MKVRIKRDQIDEYFKGTFVNICLTELECEFGRLFAEEIEFEISEDQIVDEKTVVNNDFYSPKVADFRGGTEWNTFNVFHYPPKKYEVTHWAPLPEMPKEKRWRPNLMNEFYFISPEGSIGRKEYPHYMHWSSSEFNNLIRNFLGVYKTKEEAESMRDKIKKFVAEEIGEA